MDISLHDLTTDAVDPMAHFSNLDGGAECSTWTSFQVAASANHAGHQVEVDVTCSTDVNAATTFILDSLVLMPTP